MTQVIPIQRHEAQGADRILARGIALGGHVHAICRLKVCCIKLAEWIVRMPQAFSLPRPLNPVPRAVPWASMP